MSTKYRAIRDSYGFRGYHWEKGEETEVNRFELDDPALAHFERVSDIPEDVSAKQLPKGGHIAEDEVPSASTMKRAPRRRKTKVQNEVTPRAPRRRKTKLQEGATPLG